MKQDTAGYPRFLPNRPCGIDKFEGGSQKKLSAAILNHFEKIDSSRESSSIGRIIGLEGGWGSGKSNVLKLIQGQLPGEYHLFEYDAWGHQEDLQRRSFLELLTENLIKDKVLYGDASVKVKGGGVEVVTWQEKLKLLLARKSEIISEKYPRISDGMVVSILVAILTPVFVAISFTIKPLEATWLSIVCGVLIPFVPLIVSFFVWKSACKKNPRFKNLSYLLAVYNDKVENDIKYETISEDDPTVHEFMGWMRDISDFISNDRKRLVIVFDNMDRLPRQKVLELWSSIHTFFADTDNGFKNIWVIIPFDEKHLACAFGEEDPNNGLVITRQFLSKTFSVIYRVAPPVITDLKSIFESLFREAFGDTEDDGIDKISRMYRIINRTNCTVRDLIMFINQLVALKGIWGNEIGLVFMAAFILRKDLLLGAPENQILSGEYLKDGLDRFFTNDSKLQKNISALVYEVNIDHAEQVPMTKYILSCLNNEANYNINNYTENKNFVSVLEDIIKDSDVLQVDKTILILNGLDVSEMPVDKIEKIRILWDEIGFQVLKLPITELKFEEHYKYLFKNVTSVNFRTNFIKRLCVGYRTIKEFNGEEYFVAIDSLNKCLKENRINSPLEILPFDKGPENFAKYVTQAKDAYKDYGLFCDSTSLDEFLTNKYSEDSFIEFDVLDILRENENYEFELLLAAVQNAIEDKDVSVENFVSTFGIYKILSEQKPLSSTLGDNKARELYNSLVNSLGQKPFPLEFIDLLAMNLVYGRTIDDGLVNDKLVKDVANCIEYYKNFGDLLKDCTERNDDLLNRTIKELVLDPRNDSKLSIEEVLPLFIVIIKRTKINSDEFLEYLDSWSDIAKESISAANLNEIVPHVGFWDYCKNSEVELAIFLRSIAFEAISNEKEEYFFDQRTSLNGDSIYWFGTLRRLLDFEGFKKLPESISNFCKMMLKEIAKGQFAIPGKDELLFMLFDRLDRRKTKSTIKDIINLFCTGSNNMNVSLFAFFESWFREQGDLTSLAGRVTHTILRPVVKDSQSLNIILTNHEFYIDIIKRAGDEAEDFKSLLRTVILNSTSPADELLKFGNEIGLDLEDK